MAGAVFGEVLGEPGGVILYCSTHWKSLLQDVTLIIDDIRFCVCEMTQYCVRFEGRDFTWIHRIGNRCFYLRMRMKGAKVHFAWRFQYLVTLEGALYLVAVARVTLLASRNGNDVSDVMRMK